MTRESAFERAARLSCTRRTIEDCSHGQTLPSRVFGQLRPNTNQMPRRQQSLTRTAYHEAGHAVAMWHLEIRFRYVTIVPETETLGHVLGRLPPKWFHPDYDTSDRARLKAERQIIVDFAGEAAERKFMGRRPRFGFGQDFGNALDMATYFVASEEAAAAFLNFCRAQSNDLIEDMWPECVAVAGALLEKWRMSKHEVIEIIKIATSGKH